MEKEIISKLLSQIGLLSFIVKHDSSDWYIIPVDYWVMNHWDQWGIPWNFSDEEKELKFIEIIDDFKVSKLDLISYYTKLEISNQVRLMPQVYADFNDKKFYTNFEEWILEDSVLDSWIGIRKDVKVLINESDKYWENSTEST